jgi:hypothetical protein
MTRAEIIEYLYDNNVHGDLKIEDMADDLAEPQWIPCSERLPEEERKEYWICTDTGYQCECRWTNVNHFWTDLTTSWHWHIMDVPQYAKVVAWMPKPKPYKAESEET